MIVARLSEILSALDAQLLGADTGFAGVSTDTRTVPAGSLFVALKGERFDGHEYLSVAAARGARAVLVSRPMLTELPQVVVSDTERGLADLARWWRAQCAAKVIGITGSNGKTTVKTLTASILGGVGRCHLNQGNFNNEIGLPLSVLAMPVDSEFAVLEMGAGKPGDIAYLAAIARPDIALVNNVGPAHLERMGSIEGVAETKGALLSALPANGIAVINRDDAFADYFSTLSGMRRTFGFGLDRTAEFSARELRLAAHSHFVLDAPGGQVAIELPLAGRHNVRNALAAATLAYAAGADLPAIQRGLQAGSTIAGRLTRMTLTSGAVLIDDSYNANPGSVRAAIDTLALEPGQRWLVLGRMAELGPGAAELHAELGDYARAAGLDRLYAVGEWPGLAAARFGAGGETFESQAKLVEALGGRLVAGVTALVKGSRSSSMELVVTGLCEGDVPRTGQEEGAHAAVAH